MNSECSICFEVVRSSETQKPFVTRCGHLFHENCINDCLKKQGKCPQCNQRVSSSQLIRLFINEPHEPEISVKAKDEMIDRLKVQLNDLNEKAQLQYDLIGALNRQICLEKELSQKENNVGSHQPVTSPLTPSKSDSPKRIVAPAKLNVNKVEDFQRRFLKKRNSDVKPFSNFPTGPFSQPTTFGPNIIGPLAQRPFGAINVFKNTKDNTDKSSYTFGGPLTEWETLGACALSSPTKSKNDQPKFKGFNWFDSSLNAKEKTLPDPMWKRSESEAGQQLDNTNRTAQNKFSNSFTFGANPIFGSGFKLPTFRFGSKDCPSTTPIFDRSSEATGLAAQNTTPSASQNKNIFAQSTEDTTSDTTSKPSSSQNKNIFAPTTEGTTSKPVLKHKSTTSTKQSVNARPLSSCSFFDNWQNANESVKFTDEALEQFFRHLEKSSTLSGSVPITTNDRVFGDTSVATLNEASDNAVVKLESCSPNKEDSCSHDKEDSWSTDKED